MVDGDPLRRKRSFARIERKTPVLGPALQSNQSSLYGLHRNRNQGRGNPNGSIKRAADGGRQRSREIIYEKRESFGIEDDKGVVNISEVYWRLSGFRKQYFLVIFSCFLKHESLQYISNM